MDKFAVELKNDYKEIYMSGVEEDTQLAKLFATKGLPSKSDLKLIYKDATGSKIDLATKKFKLIYAKDGSLFGSEVGYPTEEDIQIHVYNEGNELVFGTEVAAENQKQELRDDNAGSEEIVEDSQTE